MSDEYKSRKRYLRERFKAFGAEGLMPRDAVELVLGYAMDGEELNRAVDALFEHYHGAKGIFSDSVENLKKVADLPVDALVLLKMMPYLGEILSSEQSAKDVISDVESACDYFQRVYRGVRVEQLKAVCLGADDKVFTLLTLCSGSTFGVTMPMEEAVYSICRTGCNRIILAHNHPGGSCQPSSEDVNATESLCRALEEAGVTVLDHVIVGRDGVRSMFSGIVK